MHELATKLNFGKYKGLTIQQIYQGTLQINKFLLRDYLSHILNSNNFNNWALFEGIQLIDSFYLTDHYILTKGEIHNPVLPLSQSNRAILGNIEEKLSNYINQYFQANFLGILTDITKFNASNDFPNQIGGDPDYLKWCEKNINTFCLSENCKQQLSKLSYVKLEGVKIMFIGNEKYDYAPTFKIQYSAK
jgi:hypothetical protein